MKNYIIELRNSLKPELRNMPLFQNGSAIIVENEKDELLLEERVDRNLWCIPGGLQELGETFEEVAKRELFEETGLIGELEDFELIKVVSGKSRKNSYPNGDVVYNNTVLFVIRKYKGKLNCDYEEVIDTGKEFVSQKESKNLKFFSKENLPENLMDQDLITIYFKYKDK
jgi:ADP-ribose pyrophosphatase